LGGFFWEDFVGGFFCGGLFFGSSSTKSWILKEMICLSIFWFLSRFCT
jgi:hypothetical protein